MVQEWCGRSPSANRDDRHSRSRGWRQACDLVEDIERDVQQKVADFLTRRRPSGKTGAPSYTHDEVLSFARDLVSHHLEGVRSALREQTTPAQGLQLDATTMLPLSQPVWLQHSRSNLELFAPLRSSDLEATTRHLQQRIRALAETEGGLPLGDDITIRKDAEGEYWARYERSVIDRGGSHLGKVHDARKKVWSELISNLQSTKIHEVIPELERLFDEMSPKESFDYMAVDPAERAAIHTLGRERQSLAAIRHLAQRIVQAHSADTVEPEQYILTITQIVSKLASQARPGGEFADVRLFRLLTFLALRATYRLALAPQSNIMESASQTAREELADYVLERTAVLIDSEYKLQGAKSNYIPELCKAGQEFLHANEQEWLAAPTLPPTMRADQVV